jgi:hypothetical protein
LFLFPQHLKNENSHDINRHRDTSCRCVFLTYGNTAESVAMKSIIYIARQILLGIAFFVIALRKSQQRKS